MSVFYRDTFTNPGGVINLKDHMPDIYVAGWPGYSPTGFTLGPEGGLITRPFTENEEIMSNIMVFGGPRTWIGWKFGFKRGMRGARSYIDNAIVCNRTSPGSFQQATLRAVYGFVEYSPTPIHLDIVFIGADRTKDFLLFSLKYPDFQPPEYDSFVKCEVYVNGSTKDYVVKVDEYISGILTRKFRIYDNLSSLGADENQGTLPNPTEFFQYLYSIQDNVIWYTELSGDTQWPFYPPFVAGDIRFQYKNKLSNFTQQINPFGIPYDR